MTRSFFSSSVVALLAGLATTPAAAQQRGDPVQQNRSGVAPQAAAIGYDGAYAGSMSHSVGHLGAHSNPNPAKPEPNRIRSTNQTSAVGGTVEAAAERALPRAPRRGALVLRPDHRHWYVARGVLCKRDDVK